jgi:hypothetical protein
MKIYKQKKDSAIATKLGAFLLYSFEALEIVELCIGSRGNNQAYVIKVIDEDALMELWRTVAKTTGGTMPSLSPYSPYISSKHDTGQKLIKTQNKYVLDTVTPETHPIIYNTVNRMMSTGWRINSAVHNIANWALRNKAEAFGDIWSQQNKQALQSKLREAQTVISMADGLTSTIFYHLAYLDFRGRIYVTTAYLHHQGQDLAKGLLLRADSKVIGEQGFFWLCISLANNWAGTCGRLDMLKSDKIPLIDRYQWVVDNEEVFISYADSPKINTKWMEADKPWQFLAACFELRNAMRFSEGPYNYVSSLECFIDGSTNGSQHLSALTRDEITAPYVNLVPQKFPGDLYKYVADMTWDRVSNELLEMGPALELKCRVVIDEIMVIKKDIFDAEPRSPERSALVEKIKEYKKNAGDLVKQAAPVFWSKVKDPKERRKVVKRNVMTLPLTGGSKRV